MKNNYSRGSAGGIILIIVGIILCCLLLGVIVKTYKNSTFSSTFVPTQVVAPKSSTSSQASSSNTTNEFVAPTGGCQMVISEPSDGDNVSTPIYFSGFLRGCGSVSAQMLLGSVSIYRYGTAEALAPALTIKAKQSVTSGDVLFSGYIEIPEVSRIEKGVIKFKHFLPTGGTSTINRIIYF